uniref:MFS domain-containing protein n=1 Tax=Trichobilharzia regenti TaxID=157069 RepID=A0AA85J7D5_TRIRE|nr:unnamed protein product [Trichobilharzia regenti]
MENSKKTVIQGCLAVFGGVLLHLTFGYFYTISNMIPYIMDYLRTYVDPSISDKDAIWLSALGFCMQGLAMPAGGLVAKKLGFRLVVATSCIFLSGSVFSTYFTIQKTFVGVIITYSVLMGIGMGFAYSVVLAVATTWFPERRGLIVGLIVSGFGLGALVFAPIQTALINPSNIKVNNVTRHFTDRELLDHLPRALLILGGILSGIQIIGFILLRPRPSSKQSSVNQKAQISNEVNVSPKQLFRCIDFYLLWLVMFFNIIPITTITSTYKQFGQTYISDDRFLSAIVTVSSLFNCGGRILWGSVADRLSFKVPLCVKLAVWCIVLITFPHLALLSETGMKICFPIWVFALFTLFCGTLVLIPNATGTVFGPVNLAVNYGLIFIAFSFGSFTCALFTTFVTPEGAYIFQYTSCGIVCLVSLFITLWIEDRKTPEKCKLSGCLLDHVQNYE